MIDINNEIKLSFFAGIVDNHGIDILAPLELKTPIGLYKMRARVNPHRHAKDFLACTTIEDGEEIMRIFKDEGKYMKARKALYSKAIYLSTRDSKDSPGYLIFMNEGYKHIGKLKMVDSL